MEFGLDDSDEDESSPEPNRDSQSGQNPVSHRPAPAYANHDPRIQGMALPQPVPPPGQPRLGPPIPGQAPGRIPSLMSLQTFPSRPHQSHPNSTHQSPRSLSPHVFNQSPPPPPPGAVPPHPAPTPYQGGLHTTNHVGSVNNSSRIQPSHHPAVYTTPNQPQRAVSHSSPGFPQSNKSNYNMGPHRQRMGGQPSYNHTQYSAHAPTRPPLYSAGAAPPPHPPSNNQPYPGKPLPQTATTAASPQTQPYSSRTSSSFSTHSYNHKKHY